MRPLKIGITGVRGVVGETLTPELAVAFPEEEKGAAEENDGGDNRSRS